SLHDALPIYWGYLSNPQLIRGIADSVDELAVAVTGVGTCDSKIAIRLQNAIQVNDDASIGSCLNGYINGTDVLVVRRAETGTPVATFDANRLYVKVDHRFGHVFLGSAPPAAAYAAPNEARPVQTIIYYVSSSSEDPG